MAKDSSVKGLLPIAEDRLEYACEIETGVAVGSVAVGGSNRPERFQLVRMRFVSLYRLP